MRFLVVVTRNADRFTAAEFEPYLEAEAEQVRQLHSEGIFRSVWTYANEAGKPKGAVIEMDGETAEAVEKVIETLPLAKAGLISWQLLPILPYRGFAPRSSVSK